MLPSEFLEKARAYAQSKYALGEFADEFVDDIPKAIEAGETPEYWIEKKAEKYDLDPISNGWN